MPIIQMDLLHRPSRDASKNLIFLRPNENGIFGFNSGNGRVPSEYLTDRYFIVQSRGHQELARLISGRAALVMQLPFIGEALLAISLSGLPEDISKFPPGARRSDELGINTGNRTGFEAQFIRQTTKIDQASY